MRGILATLVAFACGFAVAEDFYWSGKGGDNRWDNKDNWATDTAPATLVLAAAGGVQTMAVYDLRTVS